MADKKSDKTNDPDLIVDQDPIIDPVIDPIVDQDQDPEPIVDQDPEVIVDPDPIPVKTAPIIEITDGGMVPVPAPPVARPEIIPAGPAVVGLGVVDEVFLDKCIYKNLYNRKSLTIHHLQRRLYELGYIVALKDKDGYYGDLTREAVSQFQADRGLVGDGLMTAESFELIFANDQNVKVVL